MPSRPRSTLTRGMLYLETSDGVRVGVLHAPRPLRDVRAVDLVPASGDLGLAALQVGSLLLLLPDRLLVHETVLGLLWGLQAGNTRSCIFDRLPNCCQWDSDCIDFNSCTSDICVT